MQQMNEVFEHSNEYKTKFGLTDDDFQILKNCVHDIKKFQQTFIKSEKESKTKRDYVISHNDLILWNIMVHEGKITAIIDWEWSSSCPEEQEFWTGLERIFSKEFDLSDYVKEVFEKKKLYFPKENETNTEILKERYLGIIFDVVINLKYSFTAFDNIGKVLKYQEEKLKQLHIKIKNTL